MSAVHQNLSRASQLSSDGPLKAREYIPAPFEYLVVFSVLVSALAVIGGIILWRPTWHFAYDFTTAVLWFVTSLLIWRDHKWALEFAFALTCLMTLEVIYSFYPHQILPLSPQLLLQILKLAAGVGIWWAGFFWYRRWRNTAEI
jgi:hypothetical protein